MSDDIFRNLHPLPDYRGVHGSRVSSNAVHHGRNDERRDATWADDRYRRCRHCGFICHSDRDQRLIGEGVDRTTNTYTAGGYWGVDAWGAEEWGGESRANPTVVQGAGCPLCGSYDY